MSENGATTVLQNLPPVEPQGLDLGEWLLFGIFNEDTTFRLLSLKELATSEIPPLFFERIETIRVNDSSEECREIAARLVSDHAAKVVEKYAVSGEGPAGQSPDTDFLDDLRRNLLGASDEKIIEEGLSLLWRFGADGDAGIAATFLGTSSPKVMIAVLNTIKKYDSGLLLKVLPGVLSNPDISLRLVGIRFLRSLDPWEALLHLKSLLFAPDPSVRQSALRELMLIPFPEAEATYLYFLSVETVPLLLVIPGLAVSCNPHPLLPEKIYDLFLISRGIKQRILGSILKETIKAIQASGILYISMEEFLATLKERLEKRKEAHLVRLALRDLEHEDPQVRKAAMSRLRNFETDPKVAAAVEKYSKIGAVEKIKSPLGTAESLVEAISCEKFLTMSEEQRAASLSTVKTPETFRKSKEALKQILKQTSERALGVEILQLFGKWGNKADAPVLQHLLKNGDPGIIASAIKAISRLDPDTLIPLLNPFLAHENIFVKSAALEFYVGIDKEDAVHHLEAMLKAPQALMRRHALGLVPLLDYCCAEPLLLEFLEKESDPELKKDAGFILASNPSITGIQAIFSLTHDEKRGLNKSLQELWEITLASGSAVLGKDPGVLESECLSAWKSLKTTQAAPLPDYSFQKISEKIKVSGISGRTRPSEISDFPFSLIREHYWKIALAGVAFLAIAGLFFLRNGVATTGNENVSSPAKIGGTTKLPESFSPQSGKGGLRSNASDLISGKPYAALMQSAQKEQMESRASLAEKREAHLKRLSQNQEVDLLVRMNAEAELNVHLLVAMEATQQGQWTNAREAFGKLLADKTANPLARARAHQGLLNIAIREGSREDFNKCVENFLLEMGSLPNCGELKNHGLFTEKLKEMTKAGEQLQVLARDGKVSAPQIEEHLRHFDEIWKDVREVK